MKPKIKAAYDLMLRLIEDGVLKDGEHINATALAEEHGMSSYTVQEAFVPLGDERRLTKFSTLGWYVGNHTKVPNTPRAVRHQRSPEVIVAAGLIVEDIDRGVRQVGTPLYQRAIAEEFGVSIATASKIISRVIESGRATVPEKSHTAIVSEPKK